MLERVDHPFVMIASVDGAGRANLYVPYEGTTSVRIKPGRRVEMEGSIVLDASRGPERVFAIFSRRPLDAAPVRAALAGIAARGAGAIRSAGSLEVDAAGQSSVLFEKVTE